MKKVSIKKVSILIVSALILCLLFTGCSDIATISSPATVNTDGDLYKVQCSGAETATGMGATILPKGTWFMYNVYDGDGFWDGRVQSFDIQAGNPKNGNVNIIGVYTIKQNSYNDFYRAQYWIYPTFDAVDKHLAISDDMNFTAAPGKDDNADFNVDFEDPNGDGTFFVFAHFAVECK